MDLDVLIGMKTPDISENNNIADLFRILNLLFNEDHEDLDTMSKGDLFEATIVFLEKRWDFFSKIVF